MTTTPSDVSPPPAGAVQAPNQVIETHGRRLAYRPIGHGRPLVLCTRFRGNLDTWDPASLARDAGDLIEALDLDRVVLAGWSIGGLAAQVALTQYPQLISHLILIGTSPPGPLIRQAEQLFYDIFRKPENDLIDEGVLFFEPASKQSLQAAQSSHDRMAARTTDTSENWYALSQQLPMTQLLTYPRAGTAHTTNIHKPRPTTSRPSSLPQASRGRGTSRPGEGSSPASMRAVLPPVPALWRRVSAPGAARPR
ncbi:alpha/beta hydrolase [Streptomyces justiciae]|uniref:Alpha/beta hydrolase n=1 Tax=Streptomyces justiciae TaxID=2780140 RepID=A0ABU3LVY9_9ACTN|nr:alpha/beta hydrolase [Streptomyces justiciae]MDT7843390.1 alpha/beta hydrolase [Streptomyces justiciae]